MDWAIVTWTILVGMVGLLWVMAMAVIQEESEETPVESSSSDESGTDDAIEGVQGHQRNAA